MEDTDSFHVATTFVLVVLFVKKWVQYLNNRAPFPFGRVTFPLYRVTFPFGRVTFPLKLVMSTNHFTYYKNTITSYSTQLISIYLILSTILH